MYIQLYVCVRYFVVFLLMCVCVGLLQQSFLQDTDISHVRCIQIHAYTYIRVYTQVYTHIYIHTYLYKHICIYVFAHCCTHRPKRSFCVLWRAQIRHTLLS